MGAAELDGPVAGGECPTLILDEVEERQDGGQLPGGDDRVGAFQAAPERQRTGRAGRSMRARIESGATREPDILLAIEERDRIAPDGDIRRVRRIGPPGSFLLGGQHDRHDGRGDRLLKRLGDRRLMQRPERRHVGIMTSRDLRRVADGESRYVSFRLEVPERLMRLAEPGEEKAERTLVVVDDAVPPRPGVDRLPRLADPIGKRTGLIVDP